MHHYEEIYIHLCAAIFHHCMCRRTNRQQTSLLHYIYRDRFFYESAFLHAFQLANRQSLHISQRFAIGAGSGLSVHEKLLIPLYASAQFYITKPRRLTPYLECHIGGSFATDREANGGFYLSPSIGAQFKVNRKFKLNLMAGYELQKLERTKKQEDPYFHTTFKEELSHHSITLKIGLTY